MINRVKAFFLERGGHGEAADGRHAKDELQLAAAALMVEAACLDDEFIAAERDRIAALTQARFGLSQDEAETLIEEAEQAVDASHQLHRFAQVIRDRFSEAERIELIEMLWEVVYADGRLHDYEANLLRRIGGLIYVSDRDRGVARKRVLARLGLEGAARRRDAR